MDDLTGAGNDDVHAVLGAFGAGAVGARQGERAATRAGAALMALVPPVKSATTSGSG